MEGIPLHRRPTDLEHELGLAMQALRAQAETYEVDLRLDCEGAPKEANIDGEKIAFAVTTLIGNALRYVKHGSRLQPGGTIHVRVSEEDRALVITVQDDGAGIQEEHLPHLFRRASDRRQLVGLALLMVHDVVVAHGGDIQVKSSTGVDHGTTITLRIPLGK